MKALGDIAQADATRTSARHLQLTRAGPRVLYDDPQNFFRRVRHGAFPSHEMCPDHDLAAKAQGRDAVFDRVLDERLYEQRWQLDLERLRRHVNGHAQPLLEPFSL